LSLFELDGRLSRDSDLVTTLGLCEVRISGDGRWPWLILVPRRIGLEELFDLTPLDQSVITFEINAVAEALKKATGATKINVGALGNIVRQLHVHVIARFEGDANWPNPVWGFGEAKPWEETEKRQLIAKVLEAL